jgi:hypothetical protein
VTAPITEWILLWAECLLTCFLRASILSKLGNPPKY